MPFIFKRAYRLFFDLSFKNKNIKYLAILKFFLIYLKIKYFFSNYYLCVAPT